MTGVEIITEQAWRKRGYLDERQGMFIDPEELLDILNFKRVDLGVDYYIVRSCSTTKPFSS